MSILAVAWEISVKALVFSPTKGDIFSLITSMFLEFVMLLVLPKDDLEERFLMLPVIVRICKLLNLLPKGLWLEVDWLLRYSSSLFIENISEIFEISIFFNFIFAKFTVLNFPRFYVLFIATLLLEPYYSCLEIFDWMNQWLIKLISIVSKPIKFI